MDWDPLFWSVALLIDPFAVLEFKIFKIVFLFLFLS
jgi:hypothetical protein